MIVMKGIYTGDLVKCTGDVGRTPEDQLFICDHTTERTFTLIPISGWALVKRGLRDIFHSLISRPYVKAAERDTPLEGHLRKIQKEAVNTSAATLKEIKELEHDHHR